VPSSNPDRDAIAQRLNFPHGRVQPHAGTKVLGGGDKQADGLLRKQHATIRLDDTVPIRRQIEGREAIIDLPWREKLVRQIVLAC